MLLCEIWPPPVLDLLVSDHAEKNEEYRYRWKSISGGWRRLKWIGLGTDDEGIKTMVEHAAAATLHYNKARTFSFGSADAMKSLAAAWKELSIVDIPDPYMPPICGLTNAIAALIELHAINRLNYLPPACEEPAKLLDTIGRLCRVIERLKHQSGGWCAKLLRNTYTNLGVTEIAFMEHGSQLPTDKSPAIRVKATAAVFRAASKVGAEIGRPASHANMMLAAGYASEVGPSAYNFKETVPLKAANAPRETVELISQAPPTEQKSDV